MPPFLADSDCCLLLFGRPRLVDCRHAADPAFGLQPTIQIPESILPDRNLSVIQICNPNPFCMICYHGPTGTVVADRN
jgi:hypothetical protein